MKNRVKVNTEVYTTLIIRLMRYCTFIFSLSCSIASVTSYFIEKEAKKSKKMATYILLKFLTLKWNISRTIWRIEVGDGLLFCIFHALSFELNLLFDRRFPLNISCSGQQVGELLFLFGKSKSCMKTYVDFKLEKNLSSELLNMDKTYDSVIKPLKK